MSPFLTVHKSSELSHLSDIMHHFVCFQNVAIMIH